MKTDKPYYHGTSAENIPSILEKGLMVKERDRFPESFGRYADWEKRISETGVYVTDNIEEAKSFALMSIGESPALFNDLCYLKDEVLEWLGENIAIFKIKCITEGSKIGSDGYGYYMIDSDVPVECIELVNLKKFAAEVGR